MCLYYESTPIFSSIAYYYVTQIGCSPYSIIFSHIFFQYIFVFVFNKNELAIFYSRSRTQNNFNFRTIRSAFKQNGRFKSWDFMTMYMYCTNKFQVIVTDFFHNYQDDYSMQNFFRYRVRKLNLPSLTMIM